MSAALYYRYRCLAADTAGSNILPSPTFAKPFNTGGWETGQAQAGWYYDAARQLALNDGTYNDTQFLHQGFPANATSTTWRVTIQVVAHPSGLPNFGSLSLFFGPYSFAIDSMPALLEFDLTNVNAIDHIFFLVNGTCRIALERVEIAAI